MRKTGTEVRFLASTGRPSPTSTYSFKTLENRLRELAFLNSGVNHPATIAPCEPASR
jgi:DNA gyrase subunit B